MVGSLVDCCTAMSTGVNDEREKGVVNSGGHRTMATVRIGVANDKCQQVDSTYAVGMTNSRLLSLVCPPSVPMLLLLQHLSIGIGDHHARSFIANLSAKVFVLNHLLAYHCRLHTGLI